MGSRISVTIQTESTRFPINNLPSSLKVSNLKKEIFNHTGIYINNQTLRYKGVALEDGQALGECGVTNSATIEVEERKGNSQKIFIDYVSGTRALTRDFNPDDTIISIKEHLLSILNIPVERQMLFLTDVPLTDLSTLSTYQIQEGTSLKLEVLQGKPDCIMVEMPDGQILDMEYNIDQTVEEMKHKISSAAAITIAEQRLFFKEEHLEDKKTLSQYNFKVADTIKLKRRAKEHIILYLEAPTTKQTLYNFSLDNTVLDIKAKIKEEFSVEVESQMLYFNGLEVKNFSSLRVCGIGDGSKIKLVVRGPLLMKVFVVFKTKPIAFEVDPQSNILELKSKLELETHVPINRQRLIFSGKLLEDAKRLSDYSIQKESSVYMVEQFSAGEMQIVVKTHNDNEYPISVLPSTTILEIKDQVSRNEYGPRNQYQLTFSGLQLKEESTAADYGIQNESCLHMVLKRDEEMPQVPLRVRTVSQLVRANRDGMATCEINFESGDFYQELSDTEFGPLNPSEEPLSVEPVPSFVDPHNNSELCEASTPPPTTRPRSLSFRHNDNSRISLSSDSPSPPEVEYDPGATRQRQLTPFVTGHESSGSAETLVSSLEDVLVDAIPLVNISLNVSIICSGEFLIDILDSATIRDVKLELQAQKGFDTAKQRIYFKDSLCEDAKTLAELAIVNNSNIQVDILSLWTVCFVRHTFKIRSFANSKILYLKQCVYDKERIAIEEQFLSHEGAELSNEQSLLYYKLNPNTEIKLELRKSICIQFSTGKRFILKSCHMRLTGEQIKQQIQQNFRIPLEFQTLVYCGKEFRDKLTLEGISYRVGSLIILNVDSEKSELLTLYIQLSAGDRQIVHVHSLDTVGKIKSLLSADNLLIDNHDFEYNARVLSDENILASYHIPNNSDIQMTLDDFTVLNVTLLTGSMQPFCLRRFQPIETTKQQIQNQFGLQYTHNKLYLKTDVILGNINQQHISNGDDLFLGLENSFLVRILPSKSKQFELLLTPDDRVLSIKRKIELKVHIPIHVQILRFNGRYLNNDEIIWTIIYELDVITLDTQDMTENLISVKITDEAGHSVELNHIDRYRTARVLCESLEFRGFPVKADDSFVVSGFILRDNVPLCSYGIKQGSTLLLISRSAQSCLSLSNFSGSKGTLQNAQRTMRPFSEPPEFRYPYQTTFLQSYCFHCQQLQCICAPRGHANTMPCGHTQHSSRYSYTGNPFVNQHTHFSNNLPPVRIPARDSLYCHYELRPQCRPPPNQY